MTEVTKPAIPTETPKPALVKVYDPDKAGLMPKASLETEAAVKLGETPEPPKPGEEKPPATPPVAAKPEEDSKKITARLALATRKENELKRREIELAKKEEEAKGRSAKYQSEEEARKAAKANPLKFMEDFGLTYDELTQFVLSGKPTEKSALEVQQDEIKALKAQIQKDKEDAQAKDDKRQQDYIDRSIADYKTKLSGYIDSNPVEFELILANGQAAKDAIWDVIKAHHDETGETLDGAVAAKMVEDFYLEESRKYVSTKKVRALAGIKEETKEPEKPKTESVTLTNQGLAGAAAASNANQALSKEESLAKMKQALKWN